MWKLIESRTDEHSRDCVATLTRIMPRIQQILSSGGTSPKDFTLHDQGHSFRVAKRMREIVGDVAETLSAFDLSLLLLSAYLHDIGMTPEFKKVSAHYQFLLSGDESLLSAADITSLQSWLDDEGHQVVPPILPTIPELDRLALADELTTYYCRHQHNNWSGDWIRTNLSNETLSNYDGWLSDLIRLCQSHHYGYERLKEDSFRARFVAEPAVVVNLRYLALVLRVADILEFDPERTPGVVLRHRDVAPGSLIYWWKDKVPSLVMTGGRLTLSARPESARLHKAIDDMIDGIDAELVLCRTISEELPLDKVPGGGTHGYSWSLLAGVHRDIVPREGTYEYIDGGFRPDTGKLLSLLSGTSLYSDPIQAVRELLQNSFDAVSEKIAYQRLAQPNPSSSALASQLAKQHRVSLQVESIGGDSYLVCTDNGIGMTKAIIRDRVLVSGSSPRRDVRALERRCKDAGFLLGRSGQFGIGILSYFMLATRVEIDTQRAQEGGDADSATWHFETEGVGSFGELRKLPVNRVGSVVRLRLRREFSSNLKQWYAALRAYLLDTVLHCPCEFHLSSPLPECEPLRLDPGWCPPDYESQVFEAFRRGADRERQGPTMDLLSTAERERRIARERETTDSEQEARARLRWRRAEGILSDGSAQYTIYLPYFELEGGASLAFLRVAKRDGVLTVKNFLDGMCYMPEGSLEIAWKGMKVEPDRPTQFRRWWGNAYVRINWLSDAVGKIMVHRNELLVDGARYLEVGGRCDNLVAQFLQEFKDSHYAWLSERTVASLDWCAEYFRWLKFATTEDSSSGQQARYSWGEVQFPARLAGRFDSQERAEYLNGTRIFQLPWCKTANTISTFSWTSSNMCPDIVAYLDEGWQKSIIPVWLDSPKASARTWLDCKYPSEWRELCGAKLASWNSPYGGPVIWNRSHPIVRHMTDSAWEWCKKAFEQSVDPIPHRDKLLADKAAAACWLLHCLEVDSKDVWNGLVERDPNLLATLFSLLLPMGKTSVRPRLLLWIDDSPQSRILVADAKQWTTISDRVSMAKYLPVPSPKWLVERR